MPMFGENRTEVYAATDSTSSSFQTHLTARGNCGSYPTCGPVWQMKKAKGNL